MSITFAIGPEEIAAQLREIADLVESGSVTCDRLEVTREPGEQRVRMEFSAPLIQRFGKPPRLPRGRP